MLCSVYSIVYFFVSVVVVLFLICAYLQIEMCKRNHEACPRKVLRDHKVVGVIMLDCYAAFVG